jgi:hypothetical protein
MVVTFASCFHEIDLLTSGPSSTSSGLDLGLGLALLALAVWMLFSPQPLLLLLQKYGKF